MEKYCMILKKISKRSKILQLRKPYALQTSSPEKRKSNKSGLCHCSRGK